MKRTGSLFHTIVIVGAAVGAGCGADEKVPDARTLQPDAQVADAATDAPTDARVPDAGPPDAEVDAMIVIL
jgi:hypothetical protein